MHTRDSSAPLMEVNCMVLDSLVLECLSKLELVEVCSLVGLFCAALWTQKQQMT